MDSFAEFAAPSASLRFGHLLLVTAVGAVWYFWGSIRSLFASIGLGKRKEPTPTELANEARDAYTRLLTDRNRFDMMEPLAELHDAATGPKADLKAPSRSRSRTAK